MSNLRVGIDLDGVVYDFAESLRNHLLVKDSWARAADYPPPTRWEFYEDWGYGLHEFVFECNRGVNAGIIFNTGKPFTGAAEAFERIRAAGHSIHIVTDRTFGKPGQAALHTIAWLHRWDLHYDSITFASDKTIADVDVMVDDRPENFHALTKAGVDAWLLTRPWNQHVDTNRRVLDLLHFAEVIA